MKCNIWRVVVRPSYIQDARFLKVNEVVLLCCIIMYVFILFGKSMWWRVAWAVGGYVVLLVCR
jgi:hypothetical protein